MHAIAIALIALAIAVPPTPVRHVEDHATFLSTTTRDALDAKLVAYERATGHQVIVWIGSSLDGAPIEDWTVKAFEAWKPGRRGHDDGLAIFVFRDDRKIAIEVGYGLEERVPDAMASRIIREVMAPRLQADDRDGAVVAGVDSVLAAIEGKPWAAPPLAATTDDHAWVVYVIFGVIALLLFIKYPRAAMWLFWSILTAGRWSGGGGDRGGFRGGGGRSGGGGARGGW
jgi:uncharacterized protein